MPMDLEVARHTMIEQQLRPWDVLDPRVLETLGRVRREEFVPPRHRKLAFADIEIPLDHGQVMLKPIVEARMLQALALEPQHEVLEVGTGTGFTAACLADLAHSVLSIDIHADFVERAASRLQDVSCARLQVADALSFEPGRQFDAVVITAAVVAIPPRFREWVRPGGRLFVIVGHSPNQQAMLLSRRADGGWDEESLFETDIGYLQGAAPTPRFVL